MTPQEQGMINGLIDRVQKTQLGEKDAEAEQLLQSSLGRNPDSLYILSQTVLVQQYALDQAQAQLSALKSQVEQLQAQSQHPKPATSFLGNLFGSGSNDHQAAPPPPPVPSAAQYAPVPGYPQQASYSQPGYPAQPSFGGSPYGAPSQGGGFLRGAMQTAAGVAAGALAFEGVESLMHGFGNAATGMGGGGGRPEEIVNNYYGDDARGRETDSRDFDDDRSRDNNDPGSNVFTDSNDRDNFAGTADDTATDDGDDSSFADTGDTDDSSFDDSSDSMSDDISGSDDSF